MHFVIYHTVIPVIHGKKLPSMLALTFLFIRHQHYRRFKTIWKDKNCSEDQEFYFFCSLQFICLIHCNLENF